LNTCRIELEADGDRASVTVASARFAKNPESGDSGVVELTADKRHFQFSHGPSVI
jgi:hypothetical protein